ncbi:MAG: hypothetical protein ABL904_04485 [Hyphomicrobiaceae bacterium]
MKVDRQTAGVIAKSGSAVDQDEAGFALLVVIWFSGLLALLALSFASSARVHVKLAANAVANADAELLADGGIQIGFLHLIASHGKREHPEALSRSCRFSTGDALFLAVTDEAGKIDINFASSELLAALLEGIGRSQQEATRLANAVVNYRDHQPAFTKSSNEKPLGHEAAAWGGPFISVRHVRGVPGMNREIFDAVLPYITVHSGQEGIDRAAASPALVALLTRSRSAGTDDVRIDPHAALSSVDRGQLSPSFTIVSTRQAFLVRAAVATKAGAHFVREAVVSIVPKQSRSSPMMVASDPGFGTIARARRNTPTPPSMMAKVLDWRAPLIEPRERSVLSDFAMLPEC